MAIVFRPINQADIPECTKLMPDGAMPPDWFHAVCLEIDGKIRGFAAFRYPIQVEPLGATDAFAAVLLASWIDGKLSNESSYEFFVLDSNAPFQRLLKKHWPAVEVRPGQGKFYEVRRF